MGPPWPVRGAVWPVRGAVWRGCRPVRGVGDHIRSGSYCSAAAAPPAHPPVQIIFNVGVHGRRPPLPDCCPAPLGALVQQCWQDDPALRPPFTHIVVRLKVGLRFRVHIHINSPLHPRTRSSSLPDRSTQAHPTWQKQCVCPPGDGGCSLPPFSCAHFRPSPVCAQEMLEAVSGALQGGAPLPRQSSGPGPTLSQPSGPVVQLAASSSLPVERSSQSLTLPPGPHNPGPLPASSPPSSQPLSGSQRPHHVILIPRSVSDATHSAAAATAVTRPERQGTL